MQILINVMSKILRIKIPSSFLAVSFYWEKLIFRKVRMSLLLLTCEGAAAKEVNSHNFNSFCDLII